MPSLLHDWISAVNRATNIYASCDRNQKMLMVLLFFRIVRLLERRAYYSGPESTIRCMDTSPTDHD